MTDLQSFQRGMWSIRAATTESGPVFVAADVCNVLGLGNPTEALRRLDDDERTLISTEGSSNGLPVNAVTEAGLYTLVLGSRKPEAKEFKRWVTHEVLPAIRKHGMYATPATVEAMLSDPDTMIRTLTALKEERAAKELAQSQLAIAAPKAEGYDALMSSADCISIGNLAKLIGTGQNRLFAFLRGAGVLMDDNTPYQRHIDRGHFRVVEQTWKDSDKETHISRKTLATPRGQEYVRRRWIEAKTAPTEARPS